MAKPLKISKYTIPTEDRSVYIEPKLSLNKDLVFANKENIEQYTIKIYGFDYNSIRKQIRYEIVNKALKYTKSILNCWNSRSKGSENNLPDKQYPNLGNVPIILTGHAPVPYTPGIWIKNHLVDKLAKNINGLGVNVVIDNDTPKEDFFTIPNLKHDSPIIENIKNAEINKELPYEELILPLGQEIESKHKVNNIATRFYYSLKERCISLLNGAVGDGLLCSFIDLIIHNSKYTNNLGEHITFARRQFEETIGINNLEIPISKICETEGFLIFFLSIVIEFNRFVFIYNSKIDTYRNDNKIRSRANPLPNLMENNGLTELPFWAWKKNGYRKKIYTRKDKNGNIEILTDVSLNSHENISNNLVCIAKISLENNRQNLDILKNLVKEGLKIRPKALTNTLFLRLFVTDAFVHGVGGAKYDIITDGIMKEFFGVNPPSYITASATLFPPIDRFDVDYDALLSLENELKKMRNNPDKYVSGELLKDQNTKELILEKQNLINVQKDGNQRNSKEMFLRMKEINFLLNDKIKQKIAKKSFEIDEIKSKLKHNEIINNRNYPFFIYPQEFIRQFYKDALSV